LCLRSLQTQGGDFDFLLPRPHTLTVRVKAPAPSRKTRQERGTREG